MNEILKPFKTRTFSFEVKIKKTDIEDLILYNLNFYRKDDSLVKEIEIENHLKYSLKISNYLNFKIIKIYIEDKSNIFDYLIDEEFEISKINFNKDISFEILKDTFMFTDFDFGGLKLNNQNLKEIYIYGHYDNHKEFIDTDLMIGLFEENEDKIPKDIIFYNKKKSDLYDGVYFLEELNMETNYNEKILLELDKVSKKINSIKVFLKIYLAKERKLNFSKVQNSFIKFSFKDKSESEPLLLDEAPDFQTSDFYEVCNFQREEDGNFILKTSFKKADMINNTNFYL